MISQKRIRCHVGSGDKSWPLWINIDANGEPDVIADCRKLPFDAEYADEIQSIHFVEHIDRMSADNMFENWFKVLKRGGKLVLEMPCLNKIAQHIVNGERNIRLTVLGIFGDPRDKGPDMLHKWAYTREEITQILEQVGFTNIKVMEPVFHHEKRDMRIEAVKP